MSSRIRLIILGFWLTLAPGASALAQPMPDVSELHEALRLTPAQQDAWSAYAASLGAPAAAQQRRAAAVAMMPTLPAPRRIDLMEAEMRQELADLHQQGQALKALYAMLTPEQQRLFDLRTLPSRGDER